jgi:hypothetical protein
LDGDSINSGRKSRESRRPSQADRALKLLQAHANRWVSLLDLAAVAGYQHGARLNQIRRQGHIIRNRTERGADGTVCSWYMLVTTPARRAHPVAQSPAEPQRSAPEQGKLLEMPERPDTSAGAIGL